MKAKCLDCGHEWIRRSTSKGKPRCSICLSRNAVLMEDNPSPKREPDLVINTRPFNEGKERSHRDSYDLETEREAKRLRKEINELKKQYGLEKKKKDKIELNEAYHDEGRKAVLNALKEGALLPLSIVDSKKPGGHGAKLLSHIIDALKYKRKLREMGVDDRLFGENLK